MDLKKNNAPVNTITYDRNQVDETTQNIYESISIIARRADQINTEINLVRKNQIKLIQKLKKN